MAASQVALADLAASQDALAALAASQDARAALAASQYALAALAASQNALTALAASQDALTALAASQDVLAASQDGLCLLGRRIWATRPPSESFKIDLERCKLQRTFNIKAQIFCRKKQNFQNI